MGIDMRIIFPAMVGKLLQGHRWCAGAIAPRCAV